MIQTIIVYVGLALIMSYCFRLSLEYTRLGKAKFSIKSMVFFIVAILLFAVVFGMRYYVGIDYPHYKLAYELMDYHIDRYEWIVYWITTICAEMKLHYTVYFGIIAFIQAFFYFLAFKNEKGVLAFLIIFLLLSGVVQQGWMNGIRQYCAVCIFVYALSELAKKDIRGIVVFYCLVFVAYGFHRSSIILIFVPLYLLLKDKYLFNNKNIQYALILLFFIGQTFNFKSAYLEDLDYFATLASYEQFVDVIQSSGGVSIGIYSVLSLLMYMFLVYYSDKVKEYYAESCFFKFVYDFSIIGICLNYFFAGSMMLIRINQYFFIFTYALFAYYAVYFSRNYLGGVGTRNKYVIQLYFVLCFIRVLASMETNTIQYVFYFQDDLRRVKEAQRNIIDNRTVN